MRFISVIGTDEDNEMDTFIEKYGLEDFEHLAPPTRTIWQSFGITAQPSYVFIDDNGEIARQVGALEADVFEARVEGLTAS